VLIKDGIVLLFDRSASFCLRLAIFVLCRLLYCRLTIFGWSCNGCRRRRWGYRHRLFISRRIRLRCYVVNFGRFLIGFPRRDSRTRICWGRKRFRFGHLLRLRCPSFLWGGRGYRSRLPGIRRHRCRLAASWRTLTPEHISYHRAKAEQKCHLITAWYYSSICLLLLCSSRDRILLKGRWRRGLSLFL